MNIERDFDAEQYKIRANFSKKTKDYVLEREKAKQPYLGKIENP